MRSFFRKLRWLTRRGQKEVELQEELRFHLDEAAGERRADGLAADEAHWAARRELGNLTRVQEDTRAAWTWRLVEELVQDLRYAGRSLARRPLLSAVSVVSLALGIGVNTAVFSIFDRLLLRRLPVPDPQAIVNITSPGPRPGSVSVTGAGGPEATFSHPLFRDLERVQTVFSGIAAHRDDVGVNLGYHGETLSGRGVLVSGSYFSTLALRPALGRLLVDDDDRVGGAHDVVVLSHSYWSRRFGASPALLDDKVIINGLPATIVGVAPEGFNGTDAMARPDVFLPLAAAERLRSVNTYDNRHDHWLYVFGRLREGVSRAQAAARLAPPFKSVIRDVEFPQQRTELGDRDPKTFLARTIVLEDGSRGGSAARDVAPIVLSLLFVVTGLVLLIACANVANLLLARAADRSAEMALRLSLGASTGRLLRLLLTEACLLGLLGSVLAILVARLTVNGALAFMPPANEQALFRFELNGSLILFAGAMGLATSLFFGLFPAVHSVRTSVAAGLSNQPARSTGSRGAARFRASLATVQIALATALLAEAGLLMTSLVNVTREDLGIARNGLITFGIGPALNGYSRSRSLSLFEQLEDRLTAVPGVVSVSAATIPLLGNTFANNMVTVQGFDPSPDADVGAANTNVGAAYFSTLGIPLLRGREFTRADTGDSPTVAIVNEAFAKKFGLGREAVGKRLALGRGRPLDLEIVGLVADAKYNTIKERATPQFFLPYRQIDSGSLTFYVRSTLDVAVISTTVRAAVKGLDPNLPVENLRTMSEQIDAKTGPDRILTTLSSAFAVLATLLAVIGVYAVLAYGVAQRAREFGIRMALGARAIDVGRLVVLQVARMTLVGGLVGAALAAGLAQLGRALLFGVDGFHGAVTGGAVAIVVGAAGLSALLPIRRAARVDPAVTLRAE